MKRRQFLEGLAASAALTGISGRATLAQTSTELFELSAREARKLIASGQISALEYAEALLGRCETCKALNAFITLDGKALLNAARSADQKRAQRDELGPLHGLPIAVKDNIDTASMPTSGGTPALRDNVPPRDAPVVHRLFEAGALLAGKTNMHELAFGITNNNAAFGPARNPYDPRMIPGGSSGGTAVALAARLAPLGLGSDTGGSVRIPAALCGIAGMRPTIGRYPASGVVPISATRDTPGPMARDIADLALLDGVSTGAAQRIKPLDLRDVRLGVPKPYFYDDLDPELVQAMDRSLATLADLGAVLVEVALPHVAELDHPASFTIVFYEALRGLARYLEQSSVTVGVEDVVDEIASPDVAEVFRVMRNEGKVSDADYRKAVEQQRPRLQEAYRRYFLENRVLAMVFPTTPLPARPIGEDDTVMLNGKRVPTFSTYIRNCDPGSVAGVPGVSLPIGLTKAGLPLGLEIDGPWGSDRILLQLAYALEGATAPLAPPPACPA